MPDYISPDYPNSTLLLIDVQNDFTFGPSAIPGTADALPAMAALATAFRHAGRPIFHIVRSYQPGESDVDLLRRATVEGGAQTVAPNTPGAEIPHGLLPGATRFDWPALRAGRPQRLTDTEHIVFKPRWSAFFRTPLHDLLGEHQVNTVVVAGCNLPNCPRATLFDASERDYRTVLVTDATSQATPERLSDLQLIGANLRRTEEVRTALGQSACGTASYLERQPP